MRDARSGSEDLIVREASRGGGVADVFDLDLGFGSEGLWGADAESLVELAVSVPKRGRAVKARGAERAVITSPNAE